MDEQFRFFNDPLLTALHFSVSAPGDMDGDGKETTDDAVYLLHTMFGAEDYPLSA